MIGSLATLFRYYEQHHPVVSSGSAFRGYRDCYFDKTLKDRSGAGSPGCFSQASKRCIGARHELRSSRCCSRRFFASDTAPPSPSELKGEGEGERGKERGRGREREREQDPNVTQLDITLSRARRRPPSKSRS